MREDKAKYEGERTLHSWIGSHDMEYGPASVQLSERVPEGLLLAYPNSWYNCLIQKTMATQDAPMMHGATIRYGCMQDQSDTLSK